MSKIRSIIVDDEPLALSLIRAKLDKIESIEIIAQCSNGREAVSKIMEMSPDLVFLDIQMPGLNGFDVVKKLQADITPLIIFTTAYEQYAINAFEIHAVDYILKPIDLERINTAVERAHDRLSGKTEGTEKSKIIGALDIIEEHELRQTLQADTIPRLPGQNRVLASRRKYGPLWIQVDEVGLILGLYSFQHLTGW